MPDTDSARTDIARITSIQSVLDRLKRLDKQLRRSGLDEFIAFNKAYYVVTHAIKEASASRYFEHPALMEEFSVCFAQYYFQAVNDTLDASPQLAAAWLKIRRPPRRRPVGPNFISLLMGANAHINHDLPLALLKVIDRQKTDDLLEDIAKIDRLLMRSGTDILSAFDEPGKLPGFIKRRCKFLYLRPVMYMILYWRIVAWRNYESMKKDHSQDSRLKIRSARIADRLLVMGDYLN